MLTGLEILSVLSAIQAIVEKSINLASSLKGASAGSTALTQQLTTFSKVLEHVEQEFKTTLRLRGETDSCAVGLDVASDLLTACLNDCRATCEGYSILLAKINSSRMRSLQWKRAKTELDRLHINLEARKSTLLTVMSSIRQVGDNYRLSNTAVSRLVGHHPACSRNKVARMVSAPPPYSASPSTPPATSPAKQSKKLRLSNLKSKPAPPPTSSPARPYIPPSESAKDGAAVVGGAAGCAVGSIFGPFGAMAGLVIGGNIAMALA